ncbi:hypothetical protein Q5H91_00635 [Sphingomonas sp. KR1UV-12]|uniref:Hemerythrin-like domain-containing protein n=1 Tax=Sphingomonas aurea TaxID=3063994 RepID=A0ABT9EFF9_9SPHN|nr:hemerythrin domain-containing protein [Sphingomonas sp. KR1UV-12]MDP1025707.1 hypothetical protein [Sphingomonas sp. KR1UV-12]
MSIDDPFTRLHEHQRRALNVLTRVSEAIDAERDQASIDLRAEMAVVLRDYQIFKHEDVFDPAISSGSAERVDLGRKMKIECIGAGEAVRSHLQRWKEGAVAADPATYRAAAHLTLNALRRHIAREEEGITRLLTLLAQEARAAA